MKKRMLALLGFQYQCVSYTPVEGHEPALGVYITKIGSRPLHMSIFGLEGNSA